jgi:hypothetical protein
MFKVAIESDSTPLTNYRFLGVSGATTIKGVYVNELGVQVGAAFSLTVPLGNGTNDPVGFASIPPGAYGVKANVAADIYVGMGREGGQVSDLKANYANYPIQATGYGISFGRIN